MLVLLTFGLSLAAPLLAAPAEAQLPACCRRDGKHKCGMMMARQAASSSSSPGFNTLAMKCPFYPKSAPTSAVTHLDALIPQQLFAGSVAQPAAAIAQAEALYRISFARSSQKRGPPALFS